MVLSDAFSSSDCESLARDLQEHVKKTTAPYKYPRKVNASGETKPEHSSINLREIIFWIFTVHLKETVIRVQLEHWLKKITHNSLCYLSFE